MYSIPIKSAQNIAGKLLVRVSIYLGEINGLDPALLIALYIVPRLWINLFICITVP